MKNFSIHRGLLSLLCLFILHPSSFIPPSSADPRVTSWYTDRSGVYARLYESTAAETAQTAVTTWNRGAGVQGLPTYAGVHEVSSTPDWVYIRTTGLGSHVMGPWYLNAAKTNLFPNYPANTAVLYRIPRVPTTPGSKTLTGLGAIGYFVDGVSMFDNRDAFSYSNGNGADSSPGSGFTGDGIWNRDAYVNESVTFDAANAHQAGSQYHYHANPPALRFQLGDSVDYNDVTNVYTENFNSAHSPVIGWMADGCPIYGPYGYDDPNDSGSAVRRMISGYQKRSIAVRETLPAWAVVAQGIGPGLAANQYGPAVTAGAGSQYELGHYLEDYEYLGDVGQTLGVDFDLDLYNGRTCVTPEFPGGTYAYFTAIETDGTPRFPYNVGRWYNCDPTGGTVATIPAPGDAGSLAIHFEGGPEKSETIESISVDDPTDDDVTLVFSGTEGATYEINRSTDLGSSDPWTPIAAASLAAWDMLSATDTGAVATNAQDQYRVNRTGLAAFDDAGFDYPGIPGGATPTFTATFPTVPPLPPQVAVTSITVGGIVATILSYDQATGTVELSFDDSSLAPGSYNAILNFSPGGTPTQVLSTNQYTVPAGAQNNILLLIVDDWATDSSPIDNNSTLNPGTTFPTMATLQALASGGVRFTNGYSQPVCSPMRATILTGRQAWRTGVGAPSDSLPTAETTLPEAFATAGSPYALASFGKWHLGGGVDGYSILGGWPEFRGITGGGVADYYAWTKNTNGNNSASTAYTTTDQVTDAVAFIDAQELADTPWFVWMGFNAPHDPFHEPPAGLLQGGTGTSDRELYEKALEALDTEIGRLLLSVDPATTNIILVGDNGTPGQVVQAPYGNGHAKGGIYEGGIHVPFVVKGPAITAPALTPGSTSDRFVHVIDLFPTILDLAGIPLPGTGVDATSILPILDGTDAANRCIVTERFNSGTPGRSIRDETYPDYKLLIFGDPFDTLDVPTFEFYNIATDENEQTPLPSSANQAAYDALIAKDLALGGGFSDPSSGGDTIYIELPNPGGPPQVPQLLNPAMNPISPTSIVVDGVAASFVARVDSGALLADEGDDTENRYWVKCIVPTAAPYTSAVVTFTVQNVDRVFNSINTILVKP